MEKCWNNKEKDRPNFLEVSIELLNLFNKLKQLTTQDIIQLNDEIIEEFHLKMKKKGLQKEISNKKEEKIKKNENKIDFLKNEDLEFFE